MTEKSQNNLLVRLKAVWRREQMMHATAGILAFCRWGIPLFLASMAIDWLTDLPSLGRVAILVAILAVSIFKAWRGGWWQVGAFSATHTALQVEKRVGGLESLLVTAVQFGDAGSLGRISESLRDMTLQRADAAAGRLRAREIVGFHGLRRPALAVLVSVLIIGVLALVSGPILIAGATRMFAPWLSVRYPTRTQIEIANGDLVVKEGDRAQIQARVSGVIPRKAKLALRTGTGASRLHELAIANGGCEYAMESVFRGFEYQVIAGDARSRWYTVQVIPPPRIERAEVRLEFPAYTERPAESGEALTVVVPENTGIQWRLTLDRAVSKAQFMIGDDETQPLDISSDGCVVTMRRVATESRSYSFSWVERDHGFSFTSPRYYVQVSPDQRPNVELTSPRADLYATQGRKIDLAFRGRDDYGFGESVISYRVNKTGEVKIPFPVPAIHDGSEQKIDWDYRTVLPELAVGDSVSFAVELADRYPGPNGAHRARSDARRITFLSREQYLEQIAKQKQRLLSQLQTIYREERAVHDLVRRLDPLDDAFVQTCQLEAVRQDLMRERLGLLSKEMNALIEDLAANDIKDEANTAVLSRLAKAIQAISDEQFSIAAADLRSLASVSGIGAASTVPDPAPTVRKVDSAARELGLIVLELGYKDAADVIARELHATAQNQATLRLKTILPGKAASDAKEAVAEAQEQLAQWLIRLLSAAPREQESTVQDALLAFNLSRLAKQLLSAGVETKMRSAAAAIRNGEPADAARLQSEVIQALLRAEFRLRFGSEYETVFKAREMFISQAERQKSIRVEIAAMSPEEFKNRQSGFARTQASLQRNLQLLLMPAVPAPRPRLFDTKLPSPPPVNELMAVAESAMKKSAAHIESLDRDAAVIDLQQTEKSLEALAEIAKERIEVMSQLERMASLLDLYATSAVKLGQLTERQLSLIEKTDDAATDRTDSVYLADLQQRLQEDFESFRSEVIKKTQESVPQQDAVLILQDSLDMVLRAMTDAVPALKGSQPARASGSQKAALAALKETGSLLADDTKRVAALLKVAADAQNALAPVPYVAEIEAEQLDLIAATRKAQPADFPALVMPQKNLIHAVNAVLMALDPLAHKVDSGTGMLFAKTDMDSAAASLGQKDVKEAIDAQTAVADSVRDLQVRLQAATPQYGYILEITEFVHDILPEAASLRSAQSKLREKTTTAPDDAAVRKLVDDQRALESRAGRFGDLLYKVTGQERFQGTAKLMAEAADRLGTGDKTNAAASMQKAEDALLADTTELFLLMKHLAVVLSPIPPGPIPKSEVTLLLEVLPVVAQQKELCVQLRTASPEQTKTLAPKQRASEKQFQDFIERSQSHPKLLEAQKHLSAAVAKMEAGASAEAVASHQPAGEALRHFVIEYITKYVEPPGPGGPQPPTPSDEPGEESDVSIFMPGAVSGKPPKNGRLEWEVLGHRERAALNENFARELPLEYRAILKDYYERLTQ